MGTKRYITVTALWLVSCHILPVATVPTDTPDCPAACAHLAALGCPEANPQGTTCTAFCTSTQNNGAALFPSCVVNIKQCSDMNNVQSFCPASVSVDAGH